MASNVKHGREHFEKEEHSITDILDLSAKVPEAKPIGTSIVRPKTFSGPWSSLKTYNVTSTSCTTTTDIITTTANTTATTTISTTTTTTITTTVARSGIGQDVDRVTDRGPRVNGHEDGKIVCTRQWGPAGKVVVGDKRRVDKSNRGLSGGEIIGTRQEDSRSIKQVPDGHREVFGTRPNDVWSVGRSINEKAVVGKRLENTKMINRDLYREKLVQDENTGTLMVRNSLNDGQIVGASQEDAWTTLARGSGDVGIVKVRREEMVGQIHGDGFGMDCPIGDEYTMARSNKYLFEDNSWPNSKYKHF